MTINSLITKISLKKEESAMMDKTINNMNEELAELQVKLASKKAKKKEHNESYATLRSTATSTKTKAPKIRKETFGPKNPLLMGFLMKLH